MGGDTGIKVYPSIAEFAASIGRSFDQDFDFTIHRTEDLHGSGPVSSPPFRTEYHAFLLVEAGRGSYTIDDLSFPLGPGSFYFTNSGYVNISTGLARFAIPGYSAYASMKGAIQTFTVYLAKELGERGIRANIVAPGAIDTDFNAAAFEHNPGMKDQLAGVTALGRVGEAEDIGGVVAFLCTEDARWINAQRIEASGGMFL